MNFYLKKITDIGYGSIIFLLIISISFLLMENHNSLLHIILLFFSFCFFIYSFRNFFNKSCYLRIDEDGIHDLKNNFFYSWNNVSSIAIDSIKYKDSYRESLLFKYHGDEIEIDINDYSFSKKKLSEMVMIHCGHQLMKSEDLEFKRIISALNVTIKRDLYDKIKRNNVRISLFSILLFFGLITVIIIITKMTRNPFIVPVGLIITFIVNAFVYNKLWFDCMKRAEFYEILNIKTKLLVEMSIFANKRIKILLIVISSILIIISFAISWSIFFESK